MRPGRWSSQDCNGNSIPDECEIASGAEQDCNADGIPDTCQIAADTTLDLNANGTLDACEAIGTTYCSPAVANSTGLPGVVTILGSDTVFLNDFKVSARQLPANAFGYFIASTTPGSVFPVSNSVGTLCVIGSVGRGVGGGIVKLGGRTASSTAASTSTRCPSLWEPSWSSPATPGTSRPGTGTRAAGRPPQTSRTQWR